MKKVKKQFSPSWQGFEPLEPRLLLTGDLTLGIGTLPTDIPTGYTLNVPVTVHNNETAALTGTGTFTLTLTFSDTISATPLVTATKVITGSILAGNTRSFVIPVTIPANTVISAHETGGNAESLTLTSSIAAAPASATPTITWDFGNLPVIGNVSCTAVDPDSGRTGTFSLTGPGTGSLTQNADGAWDLALAGTNGATAVNVTTAVSGSAGAVDLESVEVTKDGTTTGAPVALDSFNAPNVDLVSVSGSENLSIMSFTGGLSSLTLGGCTSTSANTNPEIMHQINIGSDDHQLDTVSLHFHQAVNVLVNSLMPISSIHARRSRM